MSLIHKYAEYLPIFIGAVIFFAFALVYWLASRRALKNSQGGTGWVSEYRTSGFDFSHDRLAAPKHDWLCLFGVVVFALIFSAAFCALRSYYETGAWTERLLRPKTLCKLVIYAAGAFSACWILMDLFRDNTLAVCGGILATLSFTGSHAAISLIFVSLLLLLRWFAQEDDAPLFPGILLLAGAVVLLAGAASRSIGLAWLAAGYLAVIVYKCIRRKNAGAPTWQFAALLIGFFVFWAAAFFVGRIGMMYLYGMISIRNAPKLISLQYFGREMLRLAYLPLLAVRTSFSKGMLLYPLLDAPLLALGFFGFFVGIRTASDRHDSAALASVLLMALVALTWLLGRQYCLVPGLLLCSICLLRRFTAADRKAPVIAYTALSAAYYIALYILTYLLSGPAAIAEIIA